MEKVEQWDKLFETYYEDVFRFLRGISADEHLAEELTQETFYRALKSADTYRGEADFRIWLCSIAKTCTIHTAKDRNAQPSPGRRNFASPRKKILLR